MGIKNTLNSVKAFIKNPGKRMFLFYAALAAVAISASVTLTFISKTAAIILYAAAAVLLVACIVVTVYPAKRVLGKYKLTARMVEDYQFRTLVFSCISCAINFVYAAVALGVSGSSLYISVFVDYYILLGAMRGMLIISELRIERHTAEGKRDMAKMRMFTACGALIIILSGVTYVAITYLLSNDVSYNYRGATIILSVIFAVYKVILAVYNIVKARKHSDSLTLAMRNLSFADANVSLFVMASSLAHAFSDRLSFLNSFNSVFGSVVCMLTVALGISMIIFGAKNIKKLSCKNKAESPASTEGDSDN
ncbi:MAG: hypothetical protein LUF82_03840 [Clostridia bacterium]|nr:hypothetical protein [Clostridia bacterium]